MTLLFLVAFLDAALPVVDAVEADRSRIQRHLRQVEADLRSLPVDHLGPALRAERLRNLDRLHRYWQAGVFPRNDDFVGRRVPYFIDDDGRACAVGQLVIDSGHAAVAEEIRRTQNNALLGDMTHPALPGWIAASGLTAAECARIQPAYCECTDEYAPVCGVDGMTYANRCYAETCAGVQVDHEGACEADTTTGWPEPGTDDGTGEGGGTAGDETSSGDSGDDEPDKKGCSIGSRGDAAALIGLVWIAFGRRRRR